MRGGSCAAVVDVAGPTLPLAQKRKYSDYYQQLFTKQCRWYCRHSMLMARQGDCSRPIAPRRAVIGSTGITGRRDASGFCERSVYKYTGVVCCMIFSRYSLLSSQTTPAILVLLI